MTKISIARSTKGFRRLDSSTSSRQKLEVDCSFEIRKAVMSAFFVVILLSGTKRRCVRARSGPDDQSLEEQ